MRYTKGLTNFEKFLLLFVGIALVAKFVWLGTFPPGMAHDEFDNVLSSRAIAFTGHDLSGEGFPWFFVKTTLEAKQTNVVPFLLSPYFRFVQLNLFTARLPFVLANLILVLGVLKLLKEFGFKRKSIFVAALVLFTSPWLFDFSHRAFAAPIAPVFLVWALYFLYKKKTNVGLSAVLFFLSSVSYLGALAVVPPIALLAYYLKYRESEKEYKKNIFLGGLLLVFAVVFFAAFSLFIPGGTIKQRSGEVQFLDSQSIESAVNDQRRMSIDFPLKNLFINKYTVYIVQILKDYFGVYDINYLLFTGDPRINYAYIDHGLLYFPDLVLLSVGIAVLYKKNKKLFLLLSGILLFAPIGSAINKVLYSFIYRSAPLVISFCIFIAVGLSKLLESRMKYFVLLGYFALFSYFLLFYYFFNTVRLGENFDVPERTAVNVALRESALGKKVVIADLETYHIAKQIVFYSNSKSNFIIPEKPEYDFGEIRLIQSCDLPEADVYVVDSRLDCNFHFDNKVVIQHQKDAGYRYRIFGNDLCDVNTLDRYKRTHAIADYQIEKLSNAEFCNRWIFRPL